MPDGMKYANVSSALVQSSRCLFPKFCTSTWLLHSIHLAKNWGKEFISCTEKCKTLIFCVLRVTLHDHGDDLLQTLKTHGQQRWRRQFHQATWNEAKVYRTKSGCINYNDLSVIYNIEEACEVFRNGMVKNVWQAHKAYNIAYGFWNATKLLQQT